MKESSGLKNKISVIEVNRLAAQDKKMLISVSEKMYNDEIKKVSDYVLSNPGIKFIFLSGPSASGKTTTSSKIAMQLADKGLDLQIISLDNFLKDRDKLPLLSNGNLDFESINTLDLPRLEKAFKDISLYSEIDIPAFDFVSGKSIDNSYKLNISQNSVLIIEGIHALNPTITNMICNAEYLKVYISIKSEYYIDDKRLLNSRDLRLIRRMLRDNKFRGSSPENTLKMWVNVCEGENSNIRPFRSEADFWLDSIHLYEPLVYNEMLIPELNKINSDSEFYDNIHRIAESLTAFDSEKINEEDVPGDSMLHEFIG